MDGWDCTVWIEPIPCCYGVVSLIDKRIGTILDKLEDLELARDTLVVFASGHGHSYGHHGLTAKGAFHYEDLIRVPLIVSQPGRVPAGKPARRSHSSILRRRLSVQRVIQCRLR